MVKYPHILAELSSTHWAITPEALECILAAIHGEMTPDDYAVFHSAEPADHAALGTLLGESAPESRYSRISGGVGSISINGPIVPRASAIAESSGIMSIDRLMSEFQSLEDDSSVKTILLVFDSPGGAVTGISEFASMISASSKSTIAYVYGSAASAAYWLASAADSIVSAETGMVGSIGTTVTVDTTETSGRTVIRNSQSPRKQPDPSTKDGKADIVARLDQIADVFISAVAMGRGVDASTVAETFGQGAVFGATQALSRGMIDRVMSLRDLMYDLGSSETANYNVPRAVTHIPAGCDMIGLGTNPQEEKTEMTFDELKATYAEQIAALESTARQEGKQAEAERFAGILAAVQPVLSSDSYPEPIKALALKVLSGNENKDVLRGAVAAIDAMRAQNEAALAVADTEEIEGTPAAKPSAEALSTDGILRTSADADADILMLREYI